MQMEVDEAKVPAVISKPTTSTLGRSRKKKAAPQPPTKQPSLLPSVGTERKQSLESSGKSASSGGKRLKQKTSSSEEQDFLAFKVRVRPLSVLTFLNTSSYHDKNHH